MTDSAMLHTSSQRFPDETLDEMLENRVDGYDSIFDSAYDLLNQWWQGNARDFPWRFGGTSPWGVLISEVMSQQTPMQRVLPYWLAWMEVWPTPADLAQASPAEVITAWGTLGYPRRALRLQECARAITSEHNGRVPDTYEELIALPGIGDYTAQAVLSFAYHKRACVIDTNIRRVISRAFNGVESFGGSANSREKAFIASCVPADTGASVVWNQSVMELGAVVCTAKKPLCVQCPLVDQCAFVKAGMPELGQKPTRPRQSFEGTNRQVRGLILKALRQAENHALDYDTISHVCADSVQLDQCIASLDDDGLIVIGEDHMISLP